MHKMENRYDEDFSTLHKDAIIIDCCQRAVLKSQYFDDLSRSGVSSVVLTLEYFEHYGFKQASGRSFQHSIRRIAQHLQWIEANRDKAILVNNAQDIYSAKDKGKTAVIFAHQNASFIEDDLNMLTVLNRLGLRIMQLTYNDRNLLGDGCAERTNAGLSEFGLAVVKRMNELGMLIDLAHCGEQTTLDAIEASRDPVIVSHSCCKSLCDNVRNKTDEIIKKVAERGGVVGITMYHPLLGARKGHDVSIEDFLDHVEFVINLAGIDHVGFGSDWDSGADKAAQNANVERFEGMYPEVDGMCSPGQITKGLENVLSCPSITHKLVQRGYSDADVHKILGKNFLRVFERVWRK